MPALSRPMTEVRTPGAATIELVSAQLGVPTAADAEVHPVRGRGPPGRGPRAGRPRGDRRRSSRGCYFPHRRPPLRRRRFRGTRATRRGSSAPRGWDGRHHLRGSIRCEGGVELDHGGQRGRHARDRRQRRPRLPGGPLGGPCRRSAKATAARSTAATLHVGRSIVVGHIYQLGTKYSEPLRGDVPGRGRSIRVCT